jgi:O-antigen/teichoic acid export membrane protein
MVKPVQERETILKEILTAVRHTAVYGLGSVLAKAIGFLMLPFYTHYLNPRDYGVLEILDLSVSLFGMVLHMGIATALLRSYGMAPTAAEKKATASTGFLFAAVTGILTFFVLAPAVPSVSRMLLGPGVPSRYLLLSFGSFILGYIGNMPRTYLRAREASGTFTAVETAGLLVMLALNIYFIAFLKIGLVGILLSAVLVNSAQTLGLSIWMLRDVGLRFKGSLLRHMAAFGLPLILSNVALFALNWSDRFFLQHLRSLDTVGIYAVGYKFAFMLNYLLVQPFYVMWQSRMYNIYARAEHPKIFGQIFVLYSLLLIYAALALSVLSPEVVHLMAGTKFEGARDVIPIVSLAYVFCGVGYYVQLGLYLTGNTKKVGMISVVAAVINLALNYVLIFYFGMLGAAWATLLGFIAIAAGSYWLSQRALPLPLGANRVAAALLIAIMLYVVCLKAGSALPLALTTKVACLLVFPLIVWKSGLLSEAELGTLASAKEKTMAGVFRRLEGVTGR